MNSRTGNNMRTIRNREEKGKSMKNDEKCESYYKKTMIAYFSAWKNFNGRTDDNTYTHMKNKKKKTLND